MEVRIPHGQPLDVTAAPTIFPPGSRLGLRVSLRTTVQGIANAIEEMTRIPGIHWQIQVESKRSRRTIKAANSASDSDTELAAFDVTSDDKLVAGYGDAMVRYCASAESASCHEATACMLVFRFHAGVGPHASGRVWGLHLARREGLIPCRPFHADGEAIGCRC